MSVRTILVAAGALACGAAAAQQDDYSKVEIKSEKLVDNLYVMTGAGGNMALLTGPDGAVLVDDQFAPLAPKIRTAIAALTDKPVRFVINTHSHFDHTGGNEAFGKAGSVIVAQDNSLKRLTTKQLIDFFNIEVPPMPKAGLPIVTFPQSLSLHLNGEDIDAVHAPNAHTDNDAILYFRNANVVHMGDVVQGPYYGFIDMGIGGSIDGVVRAVADAIAAGKTQEEVLASKPTREFDERYEKGFLKADQWVQRLYVDLRKAVPPKR
ncbi:MAG TPA: MBL fold metallo-hydrolase [Steroidobacteraceae bacterium]|nr:MBL fold metallo-hydrolase [Steroidobacteraceae bacterium]